VSAGNRGRAEAIVLELTDDLGGVDLVEITHRLERELDAAEARGRAQLSREAMTVGGVG
jgi:hypothetical protein